MNIVEAIDKMACCVLSCHCCDSRFVISLSISYKSNALIRPNSLIIKRFTKLLHSNRIFHYSVELNVFMLYMPHCMFIVLRTTIFRSIIYSIRNGNHIIIKLFYKILIQRFVLTADVSKPTFFNRYCRSINYYEIM